jgi:tetratricopeptide (TPR) repeat protein
MKISSFLNRHSLFPLFIPAAMTLIALAWSRPVFCGEIHDAVKAGDLAKVKALIKDNPKLVSSRDDFSKTPLHIAAQEGHKDVVELLLAKGAEVNAVDFFGFTPLYLAQATLKSNDLATNPSDATHKETMEKRNACYGIIGMISVEEKKYSEAIKAFKQALKIRENAEGYYHIALCLHAQIKIDEAMLWYAKTDLWCEKNAKESNGCEDITPKAKENLEKIYRSIHDVSFGLWKVYNQAKGKPDSFWTSDEN